MAKSNLQLGTRAGGTQNIHPAFLRKLPAPLGALERKPRQPWPWTGDAERKNTVGYTFSLTRRNSWRNLPSTATPRADKATETTNHFSKSVMFYRLEGWPPSEQNRRSWQVKINAGEAGGEWFVICLTRLRSDTRQRWSLTGVTKLSRGQISSHLLRRCRQRTYLPMPRDQFVGFRTWLWKRLKVLFSLISRSLQAFCGDSCNRLPNMARESN